MKIKVSYYIKSKKGCGETTPLPTSRNADSISEQRHTRTHTPFTSRAQAEKSARMPQKAAAWSFIAVRR